MGLGIFLLIYSGNISAVEELADGFWHQCMRLSTLAFGIIKIQVG
jgi:hypothetical protein